MVGCAQQHGVHEDASERVCDIALINAPFASAEYPSLEAARVLRACREAGRGAELLHLNHEFADRIGHSSYQKVAGYQRSLGVAEWVGATALRDAGAGPDAAVLRARQYASFAAYLLDRGAACQRDVDRLASIGAEIAPFVRQAVNRRDWSGTRLALLCCKHQQLGTSLTIARELRRCAPHVSILLFGEMVNGTGEARTVVDHFAEVDGVLVRSPAALLSRDMDAVLDRRPVPGLLLRGEPYEEPTGERKRGMVEAQPQYDDFYQRFTNDPVESILPFQASQGCWWADKAQCTYCGLIEQNQTYVSSTPDQVVDDVLTMVSQYETMRVVTADLLLDYRYIDTVFARLQAMDVDIELFFEVKADLSKQQLRQLLAGGVTSVQAGLETFDQDMLKRMRKGTTVFQNLRFLKWCTELGVHLTWNYLYGFPGETAASLARQTDLVRRLRHLLPPDSVTPVRVERHSPYCDHPEHYGLRITGPSEPYLHTFDLPLEALNGIAREFKHEFTCGEDPRRAAGPLRDAVERWAEGWQDGRFVYQRGVGFVKVRDFRHGSRVLTLRGWHAAAFLMLDTDMSEAALHARLEAEGHGLSRGELHDGLHAMMEQDLVYGDRGRWLALVPRIKRTGRAAAAGTAAAAHLEAAE